MKEKGSWAHRAMEMELNKSQGSDWPGPTAPSGYLKGWSKADASHREIRSVLCEPLEGWDREGGRETQEGGDNGICVYVWLIHFVIQQKLTQQSKAIVLQSRCLKKKRARQWDPAGPTRGTHSNADKRVCMGWFIKYLAPSDLGRTCWTRLTPSVLLTSPLTLDHRPPFLLPPSPIPQPAPPQNTESSSSRVTT